MSHVLELPKFDLPPLPDLWRTVPAASPGPHMAPAEIEPQLAVIGELVEPVAAVEPIVAAEPARRPIDFPRPMLGAGRTRAGVGDAA